MLRFLIRTVFRAQTGRRVLRSCSARAEYVAVITTLCVGAPWCAQSLHAQVAQPAALRGPETAHNNAMHYGLIAAGALAAATGNQIISSPKGWDRSWDGYAKRLGDQVAFAVIEEGVRTAVDAAVDWHPDTVPCRRNAAGQVGVLRRTGCAIRQTALMRTPQEAARPNLPFLTGVVVASAASVAWRPERKDPVKARALVATRIAVVFSASAATTLVTTWWRDR